MVTTRSGTSSAKSNANLNDPEDATNEGLPAEKPGRKRRKALSPHSDDEDSDVPPSDPFGTSDTARTEQIVRRSGNRGKLRGMMDMPVDIFAEVKYHTDNRQRSILMSIDFRSALM
ncbi:hypothetical protein FRC01_006831 [Tulasnella sp. 417]|nr:hypothetical protein FRC01_006831 [Tulasnella sp. 417]